MGTIYYEGGVSGWITEEFVRSVAEVTVRL